MTIRPFKPGKNLICTTLRKYAINTYSDCSMGCLYCYREAFRYRKEPPGFWDSFKLKLGLEVREKSKPRFNILKTLEREAKRKEKLPVYISPLTDPYCEEERKNRLTRQVITILGENGFPLMPTTKSDIVLDDLNLLRKYKSMVSFSITTIDKEKAKLLEPYAPSPDVRLDAINQISENNIPTTVRIQPIIPTVNDQEDEIEELIKESMYHGVNHIMTGTFKLVKPAWEKMKRKMPKETIEELTKIYFENPVKKWKYYYAPQQLRFETMKKVSDLAKKHGVKSFGTCREGFGFVTTSCDGQHLLE